MFAACDSQEKEEPNPAMSKAKDEAATTPPTTPCNAASSLTFDVGSGKTELKTISAVAVPKIKFNEQTGQGDVAKQGYTICIADFDLSANVWARPKEGRQKIELRTTTADNSEVVTGEYVSPNQGSLHVFPIIFSDGKTHAINNVVDQRYGKMTITEIDNDKICGYLALEGELSGLSVSGSFVAKIIEAE